MKNSFSVSIPVELAFALATHCDASGQPRSHVIAKALRQHLDRINKQTTKRKA